MSVSDPNIETVGLIDGNQTEIDCTYDANGNMTIDHNKGRYLNYAGIYSD